MCPGKAPKVGLRADGVIGQVKVLLPLLDLTVFADANRSELGAGRLNLVAEVAVEFQNRRRSNATAQ